MRKGILLGSLTLALLAGCASRAASLPLPASDDVQTMRRWTNGRELYAGHCGRCHDLFDPRDFDAGEWPNFVRRYGPRAGLKSAEREDVSAYLQAAAR